MTQSLARMRLRAESGRGACVPPTSDPASPYENFVAEKERIYQQLLTAGIDDDMAAETAIFVAMKKTTEKLNPDDYEFSTQVYGSA